MCYILGCTPGKVSLRNQNKHHSSPYRTLNVLTTFWDRLSLCPRVSGGLTSRSLRSRHGYDHCCVTYNYGRRASVDWFHLPPIPVSRYYHQTTCIVCHCIAFRLICGTKHVEIPGTIISALLKQDHCKSHELHLTCELNPFPLKAYAEGQSMSQNVKLDYLLVISRLIKYMILMTSYTLAPKHSREA